MSNLSKAFFQRLGLSDESSPIVITQALGLHQAPFTVVQFLKHYPDDLPFPRQVRWVYQPVASRYSQPFLDLTPEQQAEIESLSRELSAEAGPEWLNKLKDLQEHHPDLALLFNLETSWYRLKGDQNKHLEQAKKVLENFPGYIFAACALAAYYLEQHELEKVPEVFQNQLDLADFELEERDFEATEVSAFYSIMCWYHLLSMQIPRAAYYYALIVNVDPLYPFLQTLAALFVRLPEQLLLDLRQALKPVANQS